MAVPIVENGKLESAVKVGSKAWDKELHRIDSFRYVPKKNAPFTARKEKSKRGEESYWYGYRKVSGKLHKRYIGKSSDLSIERLEEIAQQLNIPPEPRKENKVTDTVTYTNREKELHKTIEELHIQLQDKERELEVARGKLNP